MSDDFTGDDREYDILDKSPRHARKPTMPVKTMHEDDPILVRRYPTVFNRRNLRVLLGFFAGLTILLVILSQYQILAERQDRIKETNKKFHDFACLIVRPFPNDPKVPLLKELRDQYHCPPYVKPTPAPTAKTSSTPRASHSSPVGLPHMSGLSVSPSRAPQPRSSVQTRIITIGPSRIPTRTPAPPRTSPVPSPTPTRPIASPTPTPVLSDILCRALKICVTLPIPLL